MSNKKQKRIFFFNQGVTAIKVLSGKEEELYYCPICAEPFTISALDNGLLTLEHIPPDAQGGKEIALTCKRCNSTAGHSIDAEVTKRNQVLKVESLLTRKGEFKGPVKLNFGENNLEKIKYILDVKDLEARFYPVPKSNHPNTEERIKNYFLKTKTGNQSKGLEIKITTQGYNFWYSKVGDLRTAFLVCFAFFGYRYAFDKRLGSVRAQIRNYPEKIIDGFWLKADYEDPPVTGLYIIDKPFPALVVRLGKVLVLLPWLDSPENFYDFAIHNYLNKGSIQFTGTQLPWPKTMQMYLDFLLNKN